MQAKDYVTDGNSVRQGGLDVAIIGMACRFPCAENYDEYWQNIISGRNCIREVPADRWDWRQYFGDPRLGNKTNVKWGGFIDDVDKFDPLFFGISPSEAAFIDPQHRLFLEAAWHAVEDAGYSIASLSGKAIGVYAGVSKNDYAELMRESRHGIVPYISTGTVHSILANRVSFLFNLHGKSEAVDTACSSSLLALHNAIRDISSGDCEAAIVGGVNALLTPTMFISHSKSGMLSPDGQCKTFSADANGYVRSEGVGVLFIKPLQHAIRDRDHIHAVIKGSAINHGGRANFLTSPTTEAQAAVVTKALRASDIDPRSIDYIEAHGTGTPLGDPIEINGLKKAFAQLADEFPEPLDASGPHCALSSAKTNVGHLESASGMAGIIKVVMAMKHRQIPGIRNFERLNPYIELDGSPFFIATETVAWETKAHPRRAGVSSFGMGGVNAHVVLEEGPATPVDPVIGSEESVIVLSARKGRLDAHATSLLEYLTRVRDNGDFTLRDVAYTLQTGRDVFDERLAVVAASLDELVTALEGHAKGDTMAVPGIFLTDRRRKNRATPESITAEPSMKAADMAAQWVQGANVDWTGLYTERTPRRVPLPTYPFERKRCWFTDAASGVSNAASSDPRAADAGSDHSVRTLRTTDFFIRDHVVQGKQMLPAVAHLEFARAAAAALPGYAPGALILKDVYWIAPVVVGSQDVRVDVRLTPQNDRIGFEIVQDGTVHSKGSLATGPLDPGGLRKLDIAAVQSRCRPGKTRAELYTLFEQYGLAYGSSFQVIERYAHNEREILAELQLPEEARQRMGDYVLHPSIMDGVFQTVTALSMFGLQHSGKQFIPFHLESAEILKPTGDRCFVYATINNDRAHEGTLPSFNATLTDAEGGVLVDIHNLQKRPIAGRPERETPREPARDIYYRPEWSRRAPDPRGGAEPGTLVLFARSRETVESFRRYSGTSTTVVLVEPGAGYQQLEEAVYQINSREPADYERLLQELKGQNLPPTHVAYLWGLDGHTGGDLQNRLDTTIYGVLALTQAAFKLKLRDQVNLVYAYSLEEGLTQSVHSMIAGFARTLKYENPKFTYVTLGVDEADGESLARAVCAELIAAPQANTLSEVLYRRGQRYERRIVREIVADHGTTSDVGGVITPGGVYVVSGGAGGLGFIFSRYLAEKHGATVLWLGRSAMSPAIARKIGELEKAGGKCEYFSVDIADPEALEQVFSRIKADHREIHGVIHAAGLIEDAFILRKQRDSFSRVIEPKVMGAINLDALTEHEPLGFFVVFSSIAALMPNQGQCDYAAANSFLDSFAEARNRLVVDNRRSGVSLALNWPLWAHGGIRVTAEEEQHLATVFGMTPLATADGLAIFETSLALAKNRFPEIHQLIAIDGDAEKIERCLGLEAAATSIDGAEAPGARVEAELKSIFAARLELTPEAIDGRRTIGELGVDSSALIGVIQDINKRFDADLKPTLLFDINTIQKLAAYLAGIGKHVVAVSPTEGVPRWNRSLIDVDRSDATRLMFRKTFETTAFYLRDHVVDGQYNMPGACYVEMARQAGDLVLGHKSATKLVNNYWASPLSSPDEDFTAHVHLTPKQDYFEYEILSFTPAGEKRLHAMGQIAQDDTTSHPEIRIDVAAVKSRCDEIRYPAKIYEQIRGEGLLVGPTFQPMKQIFLGEEEALAMLELPEEIKSTIGDYILNPALLTGAFQAALISNKRMTGNTRWYIPIGMDELEVIGPIPPECYVYCRPRPANARNAEMKKFDLEICWPDGLVVVRLKGFAIRALKEEAVPATSSASAPAVAADSSGSNAMLYAVQDLIRARLAGPIGLPVEEIDESVQFDHYGVTSVMVVELNQTFEDIFGPIPKTLFFEYRNITELAEYFIENHGDVLARVIRKAEEPLALIEEPAETAARTRSAPAILPVRAHDDIAIVSAAGRFPGARNLEEFWDVLREGRDCITEIPPGRFNYRQYFDADPEHNRIYSKWGGFIDDVDRFDPTFFNISPREAELIDPQERLLLEVVWEMLERAGYTRQRLQRLSDRRVGVFVGALWQPYESVGIEATRSGNVLGPSSLLYSIANRVSYFLDLAGPSMAVDTACSSSLTALHLACQSIRSGESRFAIAAGVNLSLAASKYLFLAQNRFLSTDGRCRSYGAGGDGYVPGEGICAVLLKPLANAIEDADSILAVIKGSAINHGGRTNGYTVPSPKAQANVIVQAMEQARIDPDAITYIEGHGTGTSLGDPVEIEGLEKALGRSRDGRRPCAIGSVKSNIGHLEAAAGIASTIKVLLQMQHGQLAPTLHAEQLNPNINFAHGSFRVQRELAPWARPERGGRCAAVSSFGAGGSNAHLILEEFDGPPVPALRGSSSASGPALFVFSAKTEDRLLSMAAGFKDSLRGIPPGDLHDVAYTLQLGREAMRERLAVVADSVGELRSALADFLEHRQQQDNWCRGHAESGRRGNARTSFETLEAWWEGKNLVPVAEAWVQGLEIDWSRFYGGRNYGFVPLPTYPFADERYWIETPAKPPSHGTTAVLHPLLHRNTSDLSEQRYGSTFTGEEFFLADHQVRTDAETVRKVLPGVAHLEIARAAIEQAMPARPESAILELRNVVWAHPIIVSEDKEISIALSPVADDQIDFEIYSQDGETAIVHSQGRAVWSPQPAPTALDLEQLKRRTGNGNLDPGGVYAPCARTGLVLGPAFRPVTALQLGNSELLAYLRLPAVLESGAGDYVLHPSMMDGALHGSIGMLDGWSEGSDKPRLPFALESLRVLSPCTLEMVAWMRYSPGSKAGDPVVKLDVDLCDERGNVCVQIHGFSPRVLNREAGTPAAKQEAIGSLLATVGRAEPSVAAGIDGESLIEKTQDYLRRHLSGVLKLPPHRIDTRSSMEEYGIDSISSMKLTNELEKTFGSLPKTLFFEYRTIGDLAEYFEAHHAAQLTRLLAPAGTRQQELVSAEPPAAAKPVSRRLVSRPRSAAPGPATGNESIAIIGLSGRYPQAADIEAFWEALRDGRDCIVEVPRERWDWREYFSEDRSKSGHHYSKWGGFIEGVDEFDPLFFNISPLEAETLDPQERLFLQHTWMAIEDAGYTRAGLHVPQEKDLPGQVGVYAGVWCSEYQLLGAEASMRGKRQAVAVSIASIANRVSYALDLHGPSMTLDTMCAASLTAIHLACQDLKLGRTSLAIAGGVNVNIHPNKYLMLSDAQAISSDGHCRSFGEGGDGYVPAEGVGVVVLKRLPEAQRDGDHVYGIIRGSALNHGGRTNGYTVPNPQAQTSAVSRALAESGTDARHISYVETHGTGTRLGDPIEVASLNKAFQQYTRDSGFCLIGSVKSNIGHCESAAGIAGLTKILLQMQHQQIVPSLHSAQLNPHIDFASTPFIVNQTLRPWEQPVIDGRTLPRIAGISSFGAGGSNAHLIVEEYQAPARQQPAFDRVVILLSARTAVQLQQSTIDLVSMAYTLQVGREAMEQRLGFVVSSTAQLADKLQAWLAGQQEIEDAYHGQVKRDDATVSLFSGDTDLQQAIDRWIDGRKFSKLLELWGKGLEIDWSKLYGEAKPQRMSLPVYPFARQRYWIDTGAAGQVPAIGAATTVLHPLLHSNTSDLSGQRYRSTFTGKEAFLADHQIRTGGSAGEKVLPGVAYLEMARAAIMHASPVLPESSTLELVDTVWLKPVIVAEPRQVSISLVSEDDDRIEYEIYTVEAGQETVHCRGNAVFSREPAPARLELEQLRRQMGRGRLEASGFYAMCARMGLDYGPAHRGITALDLGDEQLLAELRLPHVVEESQHEYVLHPSVMDSALQASLALLVDLSDVPEKPIVPFAVESLRVVAACTKEMTAWVRHSDGKVDIDLCDRDGNVCVQIVGFASRALDIDGKAILQSPAKHRIPIRPNGGPEQSTLFDDAFYRSLIEDIANHKLSIDEAVRLG
jgi:acyl transferase domain-containing protein/NAD(P)-dependent dehydrogenase (short-subunit alcohol dehydrogenase family)